MRRCYVKLTVFYHSPNKLFLSGIFSDTASRDVGVLRHVFFECALSVLRVHGSERYTEGDALLVMH